jgi:subtilisin family serine protease
MFTHSWQNSARIQTNSWGNENLVGEYSSDSRSADSFLVDFPRFLVLFSAGDLGSSGASSVTPPGTAKNVLTVGASTTGAYGSTAEGTVPGFSSRGATLDGRIKPDLVAPGVMICSAMAEEAQFANGDSCSSATHGDGSTPLYMTLNGSSMATPIVAGAAAMVRQYLRESEGISEPRSDLIRAVLINGAEDLGIPDIPNPAEGWGQVDLQNSLYPSSGGQSQSVLYDNSRELLPGHAFLYTFDIDASQGMDITLVWNDREGSAVADQSAARLVNDLDLRAISPEGTVYIANQFSNGFSVSGGSEDRLNNVERVRLPSSTSGTWTVEVGHAGGALQDYAIVLSGVGAGGPFRIRRLSLEFRGESPAGRHLPSRGRLEESGCG